MSYDRNYQRQHQADRRSGVDRRNYNSPKLGVPYPHDRRLLNGRRERDNSIVLFAYYGI